MNSTRSLMERSNKITLASGSPRRKELLTQAGIEFEVKTVPFDEVFPEEMDSAKVAEFLAVGKNNAHREALDDELILTADTVVIFQDEILGKPTSEDDAIKTLQKLSGNVHKVVTGVCVSTPENKRSFSVITEVKFKQLSDKEIKHYVTNYRPMDKAGSYAIQEWIGLIGIEWIKGSFYNVVGLPVHELYELLKDKFMITPIR